MPTFQGIAERMNALLNREHIEGIDGSLIKLEEPLTDEALQEMGIVVTDLELAYMRTWPDSLKMAIRAVVYSALNREPRLPVTFAWAPGYDFELTVTEARGTAQSIGGITILIRSRYPDDPNPATTAA